MPFDEFIHDERPGARRFHHILQRERRDMAWLVHAVACMYDEISGGRISTPMTYPGEVVGAFEERLSEAVEQAVAAERERIKRKVESRLMWIADSDGVYCAGCYVRPSQQHHQACGFAAVLAIVRGEEAEA